MPHPRRKSHTVRNALVAIVALIILVSVVFVANQMRGGNATIPTFSNVSSGIPNAGTSVTFAATWTDSANVSGYIFGSNNTGVFINDSWTAFPAGESSVSATVTKNLDDSIGNIVSWRFWCNNSKNGWNSIPLQNLSVESDKILFIVTFLNGTQIVTGNITIQLFDDMPVTSGNFRNLTETGALNGTLFSRVHPGFVIQGGDLTPKGINWTTIPDELPNRHSNIRGTVAMAKSSQANSATSQFFINLNDSNAANLDSNFSVFGQVISGMDIVDSISHVPFTPNTNLAQPDGQPVSDVTLVSATFIN